jgi:hypothetical protein
VHADGIGTVMIIDEHKITLGMLVLNVLGDYIVYVSAPASFQNKNFLEIKHNNLSHVV